VVETTLSAATRPALENSDRMFAAGSSPNQIERREAANFGTGTRACARNGVLLEMGRKFVNRWEDLGWHSDLEKFCRDPRTTPKATDMTAVPHEQTNRYREELVIAAS
jgi:hypothetical protein